MDLVCDMQDTACAGRVRMTLLRLDYRDGRGPRLAGRNKEPVLLCKAHRAIHRWEKRQGSYPNPYETWLREG